MQQEETANQRTLTLDMDRKMTKEPRILGAYRFNADYKPTMAAYIMRILPFSGQWNVYERNGGRFDINDNLSIWISKQ